MKWREFTRIVDDLAARDEKKRMEGVSFHPIEEQQKVVLGDDAYYGVLGDIVNKIRPETESDPAALLVQFLVMVGNMIGRGPFYVADGSKHHTNLFSVIVGRTSGARKGTSLGWVKRICGKVDSNFCGTAVKTGLTSGEGIIYHVRDPNAATGDAGTADKRMMLIETEFSAVLAAMRRRDNTLSPTLRAAWDDGTLATLSKNNPVRATGAHVSLIAHITVEELMLCLGQVERFNGFANRLLWCHADRAKVMPFGGRDVDYSDLTVQLRAAIDVAENVEEVVLADSAKSLWEEFYHAAAEPKSGLYGAVTDRAEAQTIRLAMIYALLDRSQVIERVHLKAAIALWNYCESTAGCVFDGQTTRTLHDRILNVIKRFPDGISKDNLCQRYFKSRKRSEIDIVLGELKTLGVVRADRQESTGGRPAEIWIAVS